MMKLWMERYTKAASVAPSAVASVVAHAILVGAAVVGTADSTVEDVPLPEHSIVRFLAPPNRTAGQQAQREMIRYVALSIPLGPPDGRAAVRVTEPPREVTGLDAADAPPAPELIGLDSTFSIVDVDSAASRYEWSAAPAFPPRMLEQGMNGFVRAEWVVDEHGYADTTTVRIIETTNEEFTMAVRDALPFMRFRPAKIGATAVRQLVQQEFAFRVARAPDTVRTRKPPT